MYCIKFYIRRIFIGGKFTRSSIPRRVNRYSVNDRLPFYMMHSEKADEDGGVQATVKRTRLASVGGFSQSALVITSSIPPHERTRRRSRTAAFSLLGSPWHLVVVGSRKKIIARSSLKWCPPRFKAIRHYRAEFYESIPCNSACRGRWEDADLTGRYTRVRRYEIRFASRAD